MDGLINLFFVYIMFYQYLCILSVGNWQELSPVQQKKIACEYCNKYFHKDSINRHMKNIHGPSQAWQCQFCEKIFKNNDSLKDHQNRVCKLAPK